MPDNKKRTWLRDFLVLPLIVGLVVAGFTYGLPKILDKGKQLSFSIEGPITYFDTNQDEVGDIKIEVNDKQIQHLFLYRVRVWNSGDLPLTNLPVRLVFDTDETNFEIFTINHETKPPYEFGNIVEERVSSNSVKFIYELMNPGDEDNIILLTSESPSLSVFAKAAGLSVKQVEQKDWSESSKTGVSVIISVLASSLTSLLGVIFAYLQKETKKSYPACIERG